MALIAFEGFDNLGIADLPLMQNWTLGSSTSATGRAIVTGRLGGSALYLTSSAGNSQYGFFRAASGIATAYIGIAARAVTFANPVVFTAAGTNTATIFMLTINNAGGIDLRLGSSSAIVASSSVGLVSLGQWNYFETSVTFGSGQINVRLNGAVVLTFSGVLTGAVTRIGFGNIDTPSPAVIVPEVDDFYLLDATAAAPLNTFLGDCRVVSRLPTSDSAVAMTSSGAGGNFAQVDDAIQNGDTDYVSSAVATTRDLYASSTLLPGNPLNVFAVGTRMWARKDDAVVREARSTVRSGGLDALGATRALSTSYVGYDDFFSLNPATSLPWTKASVEATTFGPQIVT